METVVLNADIARLVLSYLKKERLERAEHIFCKTSPFLQQERDAYKKGFHAHSFYPELKEIICEHVKITHKVDQVLTSLPDDFCSKLQHLKLSDKVSAILDRAQQSVLAQQQRSSSTTASFGAVADGAHSNSTGPSGAVQSDKENSAKMRLRFARKRKNESFIYHENKRPRSGSAHTNKKNQVLEPFCFLSAKRTNPRHKVNATPSTVDDDELITQTDDDDYETEEEEEVSSDFDNEEDVHEHERDVSIIEKPAQQSTPYNNTASDPLLKKSFPKVSRAIMDNPEFQIKLAQNINLALNTSISTTDVNLIETDGGAIQSTVAAAATATAEELMPTISTAAIDEAQQIASSKLLDQMVKEIMEATEKDPSFDAIIQEVVGASNKSLVSAAIQCNIGEEQNAAATASEIETHTVQSSEVLPTIVSYSTEPTNNRALSPTTPLYTRKTVAAVIAPSSANGTLGSLADPNFSISKLIVLNPNDSAQKHHPDFGIGNQTADSILNHLAGAETITTNTLEEQVYYDSNTGQLTFPFYMTNEGGMLLPFLINNELVTQQLLPENFANLDVSRIEIPLSEPIYFTADQLPPNSVIFGSTQKTSAEEEQQRAVNKTQSQDVASSSAVPSSLDSRIVVERATPATSGIINKAYKSLSTPRKRAPHVRTLTFSPRSSLAPRAGPTTPLSTRKETLRRFQRIGKKIAEKVDETVDDNQVDKNEKLSSEKAIIKNVEILPRLSATTAIDVSANESSNSCNVPPLFATSGCGEESSNQTVIRGGAEVEVTATESIIKPPTAKSVVKAKKVLSTCVMSEHTLTPKRKQLRRKAVRACKRQLSKSSNEEDQTDVKGPAIVSTEEREETEIATSATKENQIDKKDNVDNLEDHEENIAEGLKHQKEKMMAEWMRMRQTTNNDLDSRLRELNAKLRHTNSNRKVVKKVVRRKKAVAIAKKNQKTDSKKDAANTSTESVVDKEVFVQTTENEEEAFGNEIKLKENTKSKVQSKEAKEKKSVQKKEFNIKIPTPQKLSGDKQSKEKHTEAKNSVESTKGEKDAKENESATSNTSAGSFFQMPSTQPSNHLHPNDKNEWEKRTANIACLLETPFKDPNITITGVPPTPGIFTPSMDTPQSKLKLDDETLNMHSYLFGSMTKSEYAACDTPMNSVVTPGFRYTPLTMVAGKVATTPRSLTTTEYSSGGGSYYKPDESEDLDRNFDKMLRDSSAQKKCVQEEQQHEYSGELAEKIKKPQFEIVNTDSQPAPTEEICVEIPVEKLRVEPIVLKRVKLSGGEEVGSTETATIAATSPHYMLASELPSLSVAEEEDTSSSSSTGSSSSTSTSASCASSNTKSSSSRSGASTSSTYSKTVDSSTATAITANANNSSTTQKTLLVSELNLDNLSEISSTEDEDWQKLACTEGQNSQLVSNEGEVRYPVRSWLTPIKEQMMPSAPASTIKVTLPLMSAEKRNRQHSPQQCNIELVLKRERVKEALKLGKNKKTLQSKTVAIPKITPPTKKIQTKRQRLKKVPIPTTATAKSQLETLVVLEKKPLPPPPEDEQRTIEVLTALNLSAKKQPPTSVATMSETFVSTTNEKRTLGPRLGDIDDNAVSNIFAAASTTTSTESAVPLKSLFMNVKTAAQRKCQQIDALPAPTTSRLSAKQKKIVRTPLGFKGAAAHAAAESICDLETVVVAGSTGSLLNSGVSTKLDPTKAKAKTASSTETAGTARNLRVSPRVTKGKKAAKTTTAKTRITAGKEKTAPRQTRKQKLQAEKKIDDIEAEDDQIKKTQVITVEVPPLESTVQLKEQKMDDNNKKPKKQSSKAIDKPLPPLPVATIKPVQPTPDPVPSPQTINSTPSEINDATSEEEDPLEGCELTSISASDPKHFITLVYEGSDDEPKQLPPKHDFTNFKMVVAIDEYEKHTWQVTDEICLFASAPIEKSSTVSNIPTKTAQPIRNIPKKRKIRITTPSISEDSDAIQNKQIPITITTQDVDAASVTIAATSNSFVSSAPEATSTPLVPIATNSDNSTQRDPNLKTTAQSEKVDLESPTPPVESQTSETASVSPAAEKIQIEDIESILSHLHGT